MKRRIALFLLANFMRLLRLIGKIIPNSWIGPLSRIVGLFFYLLPISWKKRCMVQIRQTFPEMSENEVRRLSKEVLNNWSNNLLEQVMVNEKMILSRVETVRGFEEVDRTFRSMHAQGRGVILVGAHMSNWDALLGMGARYLKDNFGTEVHVLVNRMPTPYMNKLADHLRSRVLKCNFVFIKQAVYHVEKILKKRGVMVFAMDVDGGPQGIFVPFLNRSKSVVRGPALFALKGKVPVGFLSLREDRDGNMNIMLEEIKVEYTGETRKDSYQLTAGIASRIEHLVRRYPEQWVGWLLYPWETRPMEELLAQLESEPGNIEIVNKVGLFYLSRNKIPKATEFFQKALELDPKCHLAHRELGRMFLLKGKMEAAKHHLHQAHEISPADPDTLKYLGDFFLRRQMYPEALRYFQAAIQKKFDDPESYCGKGRCLQALGDDQRAMSSYKRGLSIDYDYGPLHQAMSQLCVERPGMEE